MNQGRGSERANAATAWIHLSVQHPPIVWSNTLPIPELLDRAPCPLVVILPRAARLAGGHGYTQSKKNEVHHLHLRRGIKAALLPEV